MRTTVDLPDELLRRAKATAALRGLKLKDLIASFIERGLASSAPPREVRGHRRALPEFVKQTGQLIPSLTNAQVEDILFREELHRLGRDRSS
jgi:hypothetical protein